MILVFLLLYALFTIGLPFLLALLTAVFLEPGIKLFMRAGRMNRLAAASVLSTLFTLLTLGLFYLIGLNVVTEAVWLGQQAPAYINDMNLYFEQALKQTQLFYESLSPGMAQQVQVWLEKGTTSLIETLKDVLTGFSGIFLNAAGKIPSFFIIFVVYVIALYLFTYNLPTLQSSFLSLFETDSRLKMENMLMHLRGAVIGFIRAQTIMAVFTYLITFIGLLLIHAPYPLAISLLVMIMEFVPVIGTGLVFIPWAIYQLLAGHSGFGFEILALFLVLTISRRILEPKVLSDAVGINALSAMISLYVGYELFGVIGLFLGPMSVILVQVMRKAGLLNMIIKLD